MKKCDTCPRRCLVDRTIERGFCKAPWEPEVSSICVHKGEEPPICGKKGICNLFFVHCNLHCIFCQNHDISGAEVNPELIRWNEVGAICDKIEETLKETENILGFVSPAHYAYWVPVIMEELHKRGLYPTVVYNTNGYDSIEALRMVGDYVDIYLPDMKYMDGDLALRYSHAKDYPEVAQKALKEMFYQKGSGLPTDDDGLAYRGMIVRHLVMPGQVENSLRVLDWMAEELSLNLHISLMSQYTPMKGVNLPDELNRTITEEEYNRVVDHFYELGFHNGWVQEFTSQDNYTPSFEEEESFEK